jgi:hypothetical protein
LKPQNTTATPSASSKGGGESGCPKCRRG